MSDYNAGKKEPIYNLQDQFTISLDKKKVTFFLPGDSKPKELTLLGSLTGWIETKLGWATFIPTDPKDLKKGFYARNADLTKILGKSHEGQVAKETIQGWFQRILGRVKRIANKESGQKTQFEARELKNLGQLFADRVLLGLLIDEPSRLRNDSSKKELTKDKSFMLELIKRNPKAIIQTDESLFEDPDFAAQVVHNASASIQYVSRESLLKILNLAPEVYFKLSQNLRTDKKVLAQYLVAMPGALINFYKLTEGKTAKEKTEILSQVMREKNMDGRSISKLIESADDLKLFVELIKEDPKALAQADDTLLGYRAFMKEMIADTETAQGIKYLPRESVLKVLRMTPEAFQYIDPPLKHDKDVLTQFFIGLPGALMNFDKHTSGLSDNDKKGILLDVIREKKMEAIPCIQGSFAGDKKFWDEVARQHPKDSAIQKYLNKSMNA